MRCLFILILTILTALPAAAQTWKLVTPSGNNNGNGVSCMPPWGGEDGFIAHGSGVDAYLSPMFDNCQAIKEKRWCVNGTLSGDDSFRYGHCDVGAVEACPTTASSQNISATPYFCFCDSTRYNENGCTYGTGYYTADSRLCRSARHAGKIGSSGGSIVYFVTEGHSGYTSTMANGITSTSYSSYPKSFSFQ